jgi:hypothetical protein
VQSNLTSLGNVAAWLGVSTADDNLLLERLIASASRAIHAYLQRPNLLRHSFSERYDGSGAQRQMLRQWPVLSVESLAVGVQAISAAPSYGQAGYTLEPWDGYPPGSPQSLLLNGFNFSRGIGNVAVTYTAGYAVLGEPQTVPSAAPRLVNVDAPFGNWAGDAGVVYADSGAALTPVNGEPSDGQYSVSGGAYHFSAGDQNKAVLISYSYVPADIEQACIELVGERYRTRDRIGQTSKSLGGQETVSFSTKSMNDTVREMLQPFKRVLSC